MVDGVVAGMYVGKSFGQLSITMPDEVLLEDHAPLKVVSHHPVQIAASIIVKVHLSGVWCYDQLMHPDDALMRWKDILKDAGLERPRVHEFWLRSDHFTDSQNIVGSMMEQKAIAVSTIAQAA